MRRPIRVYTVCQSSSSFRYANMYKMELFKYLDEYGKADKELKCPNIRINTVRYDKCGVTP